MVAHSLWADGDIDLENNYRQGDGKFFNAPALEPELHARRSPDGRFLPAHDIGLPVLILPAYVAAIHVATLPPESTLARFRMNRGLFAYSLLTLVIIAIVSIAARATLSALIASGFPLETAALIVALAWLTPPVLSNSFLIFPEPVALLVTSAVVLACARRRPTAGIWLSLLILAIGSLPWVHRKYSLYAVSLLAVWLWHVRTRDRDAFRGVLVRSVALFVAPMTALFAWTYFHWGTFAGPLALERMPFSVDAFQNGIAGVFLDRENGLVWWAPVYALLPAAWWFAGRGAAIWLLPVAAIIIPSAAHDQWWGGFSPAARFLVPLVPIFCLAGASLLARPSGRIAAATLMMFQLCIAAYGWQHPRLLWPQGDGSNEVLAAVVGLIGLGTAWIPSLRTGVDGSTSTAVIALSSVILVLNAVVVSRSGRMRRGEHS